MVKLYFKNLNFSPVRVFSWWGNLNGLTSFFSTRTSSLKLLLFFIALFTGFVANAQAVTNLPAGFVEEKIADGWEMAVGLKFSKDGDRMYVWEKAGKVWIVENGVKLPNPLIDISEEVGDWGDHGLLGFALDPNFNSNGYIYLLYVVDRHHLLHYGTANYNPRADTYNQATIGRLTRYTVSPGNNRTIVDMNSRKVLIGETISSGIPVLYVSHGVGSLVFGEDGSLLVSTGDGASAGGADYGHIEGNTDPNIAKDTYAKQALADGIIKDIENVGAYKSQLVESLNGKILRIDPATGNGLPSNPFYNAANPSSPGSKVWALGFRNPFRFSIKPGTGSATSPGVIYTSDTGWNDHEEINVVTGPGMNFGWPMYEGLSGVTTYLSRSIANKTAPNPLYGQGNCGIEFFTFPQLLQQVRKTESPVFRNPCNANQTIPANVPTFVNSRPSIDWGNGFVQTRTGGFDGEQAVAVEINSPGSSVVGVPFSGGSPTGGVWYTGTDFPEEYRNTYFFGDYVGAWIRTSVFDASNTLKEIKEFKGRNSVVVCIDTNPVTGGLYYVDYGRGVYKITYYGDNLPPTAVATADKLYGMAPLAVQFTGSASSDPENGELTFEWNFGDGTTSNEVNPLHTFRATGVSSFKVTLKVTDAKGLVATTSLTVAVNNTPPVVSITSPEDGTLYPLGEQSTYQLRANVTDAEHGAGQLSYRWQTVLHHNTHTHPEPVDTKPETEAIIEPMGCDGETYFYRIHLTVTDAGGLSAEDYVDVYPNCSEGVVLPVVIASPENNATYAAGEQINFNVQFTTTNRRWVKVEYLRGNTLIGESTTEPFSFTWADAPNGIYTITARATDDENHTSTSAAIQVVVGNGGKLELPDCISSITHYFGFDESETGIHSDYATTTTKAVCNECPTLVPGKFDGALRFNGSSTRVQLDNSESFDWSNDASFTMELWIRTTATASASAGNQVIVGRNSTDARLHWWIGLNEAKQFTSVIYDRTHDGKQMGKVGPALNDGEWHHLAVVRNGVDKMNRLFLDGEMVQEIEHDYTSGFSTISPVTLGYMPLDGRYHYDGDLDEFKYYSRALTAEEIASSYNQGEGYFCGGTTLSAKPNKSFAGTFEVFPNPAPGAKANIVVAGLKAKVNATLLMTDITGKKILQQDVVTSLDGSLNLKLEPNKRLQPGLYNLTITSEGLSISRKVAVLE
ncbi:PQQ-dependent sugar dehydrogenase [Pontibacter sp. SGAir0037]|uniref:PQQ-dependent sugar dehydrogenase n=1 Tax=Pontibacter sp. SGAir0037 TaxID=2571030 RepID=UPI0010CD24A4|nr:PQQ-dependent sugar dehydrogenase [Pontibacter sp. SGAir0037]QCR22821.1 hypothetical protein C1N53_11025 [Pontibacter sp. SGAir0037]